jgi:hypothetical protein
MTEVTMIDQDPHHVIIKSDPTTENLPILIDIQTEMILMIITMIRHLVTKYHRFLGKEHAENLLSEADVTAKMPTTFKEKKKKKKKKQGMAGLPFLYF